jgi:hypothetical protein
VQVTDDMLVKDAVGCSHQIRHDRIDILVAGGAHAHAVLLLVGYAEGIDKPWVGIPSFDIRPCISQRGTGKADRLRCIVAEQDWNIVDDRKGVLVRAFQNTAVARKREAVAWADKK